MPSSLIHEIEDQRLRQPSRHPDACRLECWSLRTRGLIAKPWYDQGRARCRGQAARTAFIQTYLGLDLLNDLHMSITVQPVTMAAPWVEVYAPSL